MRTYQNETGQNGTCGSRTQEAGHYNNGTCDSRTQQIRRHRKGICMAGMLAVCLLAALLCGSVAYAEEMTLPEGVSAEAGEAAGLLVQMKESAKGYEEADEGSAAVAELEKGEKLVLVSKPKEDWCRVMKEGRAMYVRAGYVEEVSGGEELTKEMEELEAKRAAEAQQDVYARKKALRARVTGIVIAVLIAGIFLAGIVAVIRSGEEETGEEKGQEQSRRFGPDRKNKNKPEKRRPEEIIKKVQEEKVEEHREEAEPEEEESEKTTEISKELLIEDLDQES